MSFPSSPPLLPATDNTGQNGDWALEHEDGDSLLPKPNCHDAPQQVLQQSRSSRKRPRSTYDSLSSDPLFSEEPSEADAADYDQPFPRRKRWIRGPWWKERRELQPSLRRTVGRREKIQFADSGIWMGSDASEDSTDSSIVGSQVRILRGVADDDTDTTYASGDLPNVGGDLGTAARTAVLDCVEHGREIVDLSDMRLASLANETLRPLHQLIRHPTADTDHPPSEEEYHSLTPSIQLFLSGNKLSSLPPEIFALTNVTVLSLRNNDLRHVPPDISQLRRLRELNLAQNQIRFLPWGVLGLVMAPGSQVILRPNPFVLPVEMKAFHRLPHPEVTPTELATCFGQWRAVGDEHHRRLQRLYQRGDAPWTSLDELHLRMKLGQSRRDRYLREAVNASIGIPQSSELSTFLVPSAVCFFNVDGTFYPPGAPGSTQNGEYPGDFGKPLLPALDGHICAVPSLFELSLRSIKSMCSRADIDSMLGDLTARRRITSDKISNGSELDEDTCDACGRAFIIARAEWIEYWFRGDHSADFLTEDNIVPYIRRVCSWKCAVPSDLGQFRL